MPVQLMAGVSSADVGAAGEAVAGAREEWECPGCGLMAPRVIELPEAEQDATDLLVLQTAGGGAGRTPSISYEIDVLGIPYTVIAVIYHCSQHYTAAARVGGQWHYYDGLSEGGRTQPIAGLHAAPVQEGTHCLLVYSPVHITEQCIGQSAAVWGRDLLCNSAPLSPALRQQVSFCVCVFN